MQPITLQTALRRAATAIALSASLLLAGPAAAQKQTNKDKCNPNQALASLDEKSCPDGSVVRRACCIKSSEKGEKTRCKSFPKCPHRSRS